MLALKKIFVFPCLTLRAVDETSAACCNIEVDRDSAGHDIAWHTNVFDTGVCCDFCTANSACKYWVLDTNTNVCWLKDSNANYAAAAGMFLGTTRGPLYSVDAAALLSMCVGVACDTRLSCLPWVPLCCLRWTVWLCCPLGDSHS